MEGDLTVPAVKKGFLRGPSLNSNPGRLTPQAIANSPIGMAAERMIGLQQPMGSQPLIDTLTRASVGATSGGAAFAFATASGIDLLLSSWGAVLSTTPFTLIVGMDAITDDRAIAALKRAAGKYGALTARAMLNQKAGSAFHPKLAWFANASGHVVVTGSGNLTLGGLRENWEAYCESRLTGKSGTDFVKSWNGWINHFGSSLRDLDDAEVLARAKQNRRATIRIRKAIGKKEPAQQQALEAAAAEILIAGSKESHDKSILLAQPPRNRPTQVSQINVTLDLYHAYFGVTGAGGSSVRFIPVHEDGRTGATEVRPGVATLSQNYRFELSLGHGKPYPTNGRPVFVFARLGPRLFRYMLLMPGDPGYIEVNSYLNTVPSIGPQLKRVTTTPGALLHIWPESPLL